MLIAFVREEASTILIAESIVTGEFAAFVKFKVVPPKTVEYFLPEAVITFKVLLLASLTVKKPSPIAKITSEPSRVVLKRSEVKECRRNSVVAR